MRRQSQDRGFSFPIVLTYFRFYSQQFVLLNLGLSIRNVFPMPTRQNMYAKAAQTKILHFFAFFRDFSAVLFVYFAYIDYLCTQIR